MIMNKKRTVFENKLFKNKNLIYCILKTETESTGKPKDLLKETFPIPEISLA